MEVERQFHVELDEASVPPRLGLVGWMDHTTATKFRTAMMQLARKPWSEVVVDCGRLEYIDSSGMGNLLYWRSRLDAEGRTIILENCTGPVREAFRLGGFQKIFTIR